MQSTLWYGEPRWIKSSQPVKGLMVTRMGSSMRTIMEFGQPISGRRWICPTLTPIRIPTGSMRTSLMTL